MEILLQSILLYAMEFKLCIIVCVFATAGLVAGQWYHIPAVTIDTNGNSTCPPDSQLEDARNKISQHVAEILPKIVAQLLNNYTVPECGGSGWRRVAYLNMTDPDQSCPDAWRPYEQDPTIRACGRQSSDIASCDSVIYDTDEYEYTQVCGRINGYQFGSPDGKLLIAPGILDSVYVDGISVTHGIPRHHIWTFYGAVWSSRCCTGVTPDSFIGKDYFCDTGNPIEGSYSTVLYPVEALWDDIANCASNDCCSPKQAPWFHVTLLVPSNDDIEVRICGNEPTDTEDTPVKLIEIYVK